MKELIKYVKPVYIIAAVILVAVIFSLFSAVFEINGIGGNDITCYVEIPKGTGTAGVAKILKENEVIDNKLLFRLYVKFGKEPVYQMGVHTLSSSMSYKQIVEKLENAPETDSMNTVRITIPEGYEMWQIFELLEKNGLGDYQTFVDTANRGEYEYSFIKAIPRTENRLEGYLYPATYNFSRRESEKDIIEKMLKAFEENVMPVYEQSGSESTIDEIITFASVVEREAANEDELATVASVFKNRIEADMKLESCATVQYILRERKPILSNEDTAINSEYNTYMYKGLPIGPIASPGIAAIKATLNPAETNYLYFVSKEDGSENLFSETFEEHNQKTQEIQGSAEND